MLRRLARRKASIRIARQPGGELFVSLDEAVTSDAQEDRRGRSIQHDHPLRVRSGTKPPGLAESMPLTKVILDEHFSWERVGERFGGRKEMPTRRNGRTLLADFETSGAVAGPTEPRPRSDADSEGPVGPGNEPCIHTIWSEDGRAKNGPPQLNRWGIWHCRRCSTCAHSQTRVRFLAIRRLGLPTAVRSNCWSINVPPIDIDGDSEPH
jgi:hypothetical protein